jgi:hypothetical protein
MLAIFFGNGNWASWEFRLQDLIHLTLKIPSLIAQSFGILLLSIITRV